MHTFDRQTDSFLIARPCLHCMQRGKNVLKLINSNICLTQSVMMFYRSTFYLDTVHLSVFYMLIKMKLSCDF